MFLLGRFWLQPLSSGEKVLCARLSRRDDGLGIKVCHAALLYIIQALCNVGAQTIQLSDAPLFVVFT